MATATLPPELSTAPVFEEALGQFFPARIHPLQPVCSYSSEFGDCYDEAIVHHLESEQDLCARHWRKVVSR